MKEDNNLKRKLLAFDDIYKTRFCLCRGLCIKFLCLT